MAISTTINVSPSFGKVGDAFNSIDFNKFLKKQINTLAFSIERFSKKLTPVGLTGHLRGRQTTSPAVTQLRAVVKTGVDYAIYVHEGTRYMRARPFMETGATLAKSKFDGKIGGELEAEFIRAFKKL